MSLIPGTETGVQPGPSLITGATPVTAPASSDASFVVAATELGLAQERVLNPTGMLVGTDGGPGSFYTLAWVPDHIDLPGQSGASGSFTIIDDAPAGIYMVMATVNVKVAAAAGTVDSVANYDNGGAQVATPIVGFSLAAPGLTGGVVVIDHASGDITVETTVAGLVGVPTYDATFRVIRLG